MRTVLVTGPGGAGRTTVAAATALAAAADGARTLLLSAEPIPGLPAAAEPTRVAGPLDHARIDSGAHFRAELTDLQDRASGLLDLLGAGRLDGEELTELPGAPQLALLHALRRAAEGDWSGYDVLVVDLPPLTEALALLALPEQLRRYLRRLLPAERQAARALRPVLAQLAGVPMPAQWLYEAAARKDAELAAVQALIEDASTTLRLVAEPGPAAEDALRTARTGLALYGLRADLLVASRVLPRHSSDPWFAGLAAQQEKCLDHWRQDAPGLPVHEAAHLGRDPHGRTTSPPGDPCPRHPYAGPGRGAVVDRGGAGRRGRGHHPHLVPAAARGRQGAPAPGPPRRRTPPDRRPLPPDRADRLRAAPLHRLRRRADRRGAAGPVHARSGAVAAHHLNRPGPFG